MKMQASIIVLMISGSLLGFLAGVGKDAAAASEGNGNLQRHHQELTVTLTRTQSQIIDLPVTNRPVRIDYSATGQTDLNGVPTEPLVNAVVVVRETTTNRASVSDVGATPFGCGDTIRIEPDDNGQVNLNYYQSGNETTLCGQNSVTVHLNLWY